MKNYLNKKTAIASLLVLALIAASAFTYAWFIDEGGDEPVEIEVGTLTAEFKNLSDYAGTYLQPNEDPDLGGYELYGKLVSTGNVSFLAKLNYTKPPVVLIRDAAGDKLLPPGTTRTINDDPNIIAGMTAAYTGYDAWLVSGTDAKGRDFVDELEYLMWFEHNYTDPVWGTPLKDYYVAIDAPFHELYSELGFDVFLKESATKEYMGATLKFTNAFTALQYNPKAIKEVFGIEASDLEPIMNAAGDDFKKIEWNDEPVIPGSIKAFSPPRGGDGKRAPAVSGQEVYEKFLADIYGE